MSMFNVVSEGCWSISSEKDPRFNCSGSGLVGGFRCPSEAEAAIVRKERELGCERPDDLEFSYMKYRGGRRMTKPAEYWADILDGRTNPLKITMKEKRQMKADGVAAFYLICDGGLTYWKARGAINGVWDRAMRKLHFEKGTVSILYTSTIPIIVSSAPGATFRIMAGDTAISHGIVLDAIDLGKFLEGTS